MKLIIGLGNPGEKYTGSRHNLGFMAVDEFVKSFDNGQWTFDKNLKSEIVQSTHPSFGGQISNVKCILAKPQTYMNNSGLAVKLLTTYYLPAYATHQALQAGKLLTTDIIVVYDELDLPLGKIKVRLGGSAAGHHGVESIIKGLGTDQFTRIRLGIGNLKTQLSEHKKSSISPEKYVMETFLHSEKAQVKHMIKQAIKEIQKLLESNL